MAVVQTDLAGLTLHGRGKVRDIYDLGEHYLIVASDRLSAFDVVLPTPIPNKGKVLTQMSEFWFEHLGDVVPNHLITTPVEDFPRRYSGTASRCRGARCSCARRRSSRWSASCAATWPAPG